MSKSNCSIDLDAQGKHVGVIRIAQPQDRSSFYTIPIPIVSIRNGEGPRVLLLGGSHGDEFEAQVALTRLAQETKLERVKGQVVIMPMANYPAAKAGLRKSPIDNADLNRCYGATGTSGATGQIAAFIERELLSRSDVLLDLHSGGYSSIYRPISIVLGGAPEELVEASLNLARAFGLAEVLMLDGGLEPQKGNNVMAATTRRGIPSLTVEIAGNASLSQSSLEICEAGIERVLTHVGTFHGDKTAHASLELLVSAGADCFVYARDGGLFLREADLGASIKKGQLAGSMYFPHRPFQPPDPYYFQRDGVVINVRAPALAEEGDMLMRLAHKANPA